MVEAAVWYCTREQVKAAADIKETARNNDQVDRLIAGSSDSITNDQLHRRFYPEVDTRLFPWPWKVDKHHATRTLCLGRDELVSIATLKVDGTTVDPALYTLLPVNDGPPYTHIELDSSVTSTSDDPRPVEITGVFGYWALEDPAGALAASVNSSAATVQITNSAIVGVGQLLLVDTERMIVTRKSMVDTTQSTAGALTQNNNDESLPVGSGAAFVEGEVILVDAEKMLIVEIAGNTLVVKRAWDGSTLAAHNSGVDVYAPRLLTVTRGALGTTAAAHNSAAVITKHRMPPLVNQLCVAETAVALSQESTVYGRKIGSGDSERPAAGAGIEDTRRRAWEAHGRKAF